MSWHIKLQYTKPLKASKGVKVGILTIFFLKGGEKGGEPKS